MTRRELVAGTAALVLSATAAAAPLDPLPTTKAKTPLAAAKARLVAARRGLENFEKSDDAEAPFQLRLWAHRVVDAEFAVGARPAERLAALGVYVRHARAAEKLIRNAYDQGAASLNAVLDAEFHRADAEALLAEEKTRQAG